MTMFPAQDMHPKPLLLAEIIFKFAAVKPRLQARLQAGADDPKEIQNGTDFMGERKVSLQHKKEHKLT